jgi:hypothetical protein
VIWAELGLAQGNAPVTAFSNANQQKGCSDEGADRGNKEKQRTLKRWARVGEVFRIYIDALDGCWVSCDAHKIDPASELPMNDYQTDAAVGVFLHEVYMNVSALGAAGT